LKLTLTGAAQCRGEKVLSIRGLIQDGAWVQYPSAESIQSRRAWQCPIQDDQGQAIPTLYDGETVERDLMETVFHDVPHTAGFERSGITQLQRCTSFARSDSVTWPASQGLISLPLGF
jgi:hypothetical protein